MTFSFNFLFVMMCGIGREKNTKIFYFLMTVVSSAFFFSGYHCCIEFPAQHLWELDKSSR